MEQDRRKGECDRRRSRNWKRNDEQNDGSSMHNEGNEPRAQTKARNQNLTPSGLISRNTCSLTTTTSPSPTTTPPPLVSNLKLVPLRGTPIVSRPIPQATYQAKRQADRPLPVHSSSTQTSPRPSARPPKGSAPAPPTPAPARVRPPPARAANRRWTRDCD